MVEYQSPRQPTASLKTSQGQEETNHHHYLSDVSMCQTLGSAFNSQNTPQKWCCDYPHLPEKETEAQRVTCPSLHSQKVSRVALQTQAAWSQRPRNTTTPRKGRVSTFILVKAENKAQGHLSKPKCGQKQPPLFSKAEWERGKETDEALPVKKSREKYGIWGWHGSY